MKRDMELIKQVLKYVERNAPGTRGFVIQPELPSFTDEQIEYHITLCNQAGLITLNNAGMMTALTWEGHNELERLRSGNSLHS